MIPLQLIAAVSGATFVAYVIAGVATYIAVPASLRRGPPNAVLILGWPLLWAAADTGRNIRRSVEETDGLSWRDEDPNKWRDETRDDRAQLVTPRWLPILLVGVAVVATILHHLRVV